MRFSDGVPVAPYCFMPSPRRARARATDGLAESSLSERGCSNHCRTRPVARAVAAAAREGKLTTRTLGTCSVDNAAAVLGRG